MINPSVFRLRQQTSLLRRKEFIRKWRPLPREDKKELVRDYATLIYAIPECLLFDKQEVPNSNWSYCLFRCGRGFGKTVTGAVWLAGKILDGAKTVGLYGATHEDVSKVMVPQLLTLFPANDAVYNPNKHIITFSNGSVCHCYTSEKENRGSNLEHLWVDEIVNHCDGIEEKMLQHYDCIVFAVRVGPNPQILITSTPKPLKWFHQFNELSKKDPNKYITITGSFLDNPYLSESRKQELLIKYGSTRFGRQEIYGELLESVEGALWTPKQIDSTRSQTYPNLVRTVIAIDPAVTTNNNSDSTGIIVAGLGADNHVYVLEDMTGKYQPGEWTNVCAKLCSKWNIDVIVYEKNMGGQMIEHILTQHPDLRRYRIKSITAHKGKLLRADPIASLWENIANRPACAHIVGTMTELENQMTTYTGQATSPDRLDAMVYALSELTLLNRTTQRDLSALSATI